MSTTTHRRHLSTLVLLFGAMVFGMVLAGGLELTPAGHSAPPPQAPVASQGYVGQGLTGFADLADAVAPAVVSIDAATIERGSRQGGRRGLDPFEFFFGPRGRERPDPRDGQDEDEEFRSDAGGSGFMISEDGLVVTNFHVVEGATTITVQLDGGREFRATVKGTDRATDLALLQLDKTRPGETFKYLELGDSDALRVGDWVMAIGNPLALGKTVTVGVVGAKGRSIGIADSSFENFIQTDAAINRGNSGGPLVNTRGQVIGIATAMNWGAENIGFAVPINTLKTVLPQLRDKGRVSRGYLGIRIGNLDVERAQAFGLEAAEGALVASVDPDTPAAKAGIRHGDVILEVDGRKIRETRELIDYVSAKGPGATVTLDVFRDGKRIEKKVLLEERPSQEGTEEEVESEEESGLEWLGLRYQELTPGLRQMHGIPAEVSGIFVTDVAASSPLYEEALRPGDVITEVSGQPVTTSGELEERVKAAKSGSFVRFYVERYDPRGAGRPAQFFAIVRVP